MNLALDTPRRKAVALGGGLAGLGVLWSLWRGGPTGAVVILPLFYPYLLGHLSAAISVCILGVAGALTWLAWRRRARGRLAQAAFAYGVLFVVLVAFGSVCAASKKSWLRWHRAGAGLSAGMLREEVQRTLERRAKVEPCTPGGCSYRARGLAGMAFTLMDAHGVETEYGPDGRLERWQTWSD